MSSLIRKRMRRVGAVLGLLALLGAGPIGCQCAEPEKKEKPKYDW